MSHVAAEQEPILRDPLEANNHATQNEHSAPGPLRGSELSHRRRSSTQGGGHKVLHGPFRLLFLRLPVGQTSWLPRPLYPQDPFWTCIYSFDLRHNPVLSFWKQALIVAARKGHPCLRPNPSPPHPPLGLEFQLSSNTQPGPPSQPSREDTAGWVHLNWREITEPLLTSTLHSGGEGNRTLTGHSVGYSVYLFSFNPQNNPIGRRYFPLLVGKTTETQGGYVQKTAELGFKANLLKFKHHNF